MRIDDNWCEEALDIIKDIDANILITKMNTNYSYQECSLYDLIASCTTGTEHIDNRDIPLISLKGETDFLRDVHATAEHTWALIMALIRKVPMAHNDVCKGNWDRESWQGTELYGKTLGIVGYGRVGQQVAKYAEAFGMFVDWYDPIDFIGKNQLEYILKESDIVTVHVPLNAETFGMFGLKQFEQMKPTAYFINTSRGDVVNNRGLASALIRGEIAGAALDVVAGEPYIDSCLLDTLRGHDHLIITPHIAGNTVESRRKTQIFMANKIKDYLEWQELEELEMTCEFCPSQWDGMTTTGKEVYIRFRSGYLSVMTNSIIVYRETIDELDLESHHNGEMTTEEMLKITGIKLQGECK